MQPKATASLERKLKTAEKEIGSLAGAIARYW
jgi:hypothetical protein